MPGQVHSLLLTDVVDSTRIVASLGDRRAAELWAAHDRAARELLAAHGGREIDRTDGFLLLFGSVAGAAAYALAYHRVLKDIGELRARASLHVGEVDLQPLTKILSRGSYSWLRNNISH